MTPPPVFKSVFGDAWDTLPPVMRKHYANRPYTNDCVTLEGALDVMCAGPIKALWWLFILMNSVPPFNESTVPTTVNFRSDRNTQGVHFNRVFHFKNRKPYGFRSYVLQIRGDDVMESSGFGIGWRMRYVWEDGKVVLKHHGYAMKVLSHYIPLPLEALLGRGYAEEIPVDDDTFDMCMNLTHPRWGKIYEYKGRFRVTKEA